jgi:hypothetical protein
MADYKYKYNPVEGEFDLVTDLTGATISQADTYADLPAAATVPQEFYWVHNSQGTWWLPGTLGGTYYPNGMYFSNGVTWEYSENPYQATQAEVNTGTNTDKFVTPATLKNSTQWLLKQDELVSGVNIKTINGVTILGSGDLVISTGTNSYFPSGWG